MSLTNHKDQRLSLSDPERDESCVIHYGRSFANKWRQRLESTTTSVKRAPIVRSYAGKLVRRLVGAHTRPTVAEKFRFYGQNRSNLDPDAENGRLGIGDMVTCGCRRNRRQWDDISGVKAYGEGSVEKAVAGRSGEEGCVDVSDSFEVKEGDGVVDDARGAGRQS
ncbi:hypothetical protein OSB04_032205 [Centaurea solstitialis]|uniref:Uncharacterized protein n=1 Tax=Centaurea solstitialis TaxID=347529 RepID=A0AA38SUK7_9ASTR|nr:hypothetical protein OSB04_032205 [Centaurea solstitialis]